MNTWTNMDALTTVCVFMSALTLTAILVSRRWGPAVPLSNWRVTILGVFLMELGSAVKLL